MMSRMIEHPANSRSFSKRLLDTCHTYHRYQGKFGVSEIYTTLGLLRYWKKMIYLFFKQKEWTRMQTILSRFPSLASICRTYCRFLAVDKHINISYYLTPFWYGKTRVDMWKIEEVLFLGHFFILDFCKNLLKYSLDGIILILSINFPYFMK